MSKKNKVMSVHFSHAVFFRLSIHDDLAVQALVWPSLVRCRAIWFGTAWWHSIHEL